MRKIYDSPENALGAIKARCDNAQKGPWKAYYEGVNMECGDSFIQTGEDDIYLTPWAALADYEFIAAAKNAVPELIGEIFNLQAGKPSGLSSEKLRELQALLENSSECPSKYLDDNDFENKPADMEFMLNARDDLTWLLSFLQRNDLYAAEKSK